ncbi:MAG TPA: DUF5788 family protein [Thermoplasmata archaeon]
MSVLKVALGESEPADTNARSLLTPEERAKMIARIHSLVYWVGMLIPEHTVLGDSEIDLREVVYNLTNKELLTPEDIERVNELVRLLKQKAKELEGRLQHDPLTTQAAKDLLEEICGLLRAIEELRFIETPEKAEFRKRELMGRIEDERRWQNFLKHIKLEQGL